MESPLVENISAPVELVFALVADLSLQQHWMPEVFETVYAKGVDPVNPLGGTFIQTVVHRNRRIQFRGKILNYDPPHSFSYSLKSPVGLAQISFRFFSTGEGNSRIEYRFSWLKASWFTRLVARIFQGMEAKVSKEHLQKLKEMAREEALRLGMPTGLLNPEE